MPRLLEDRVVLITGAGQGVGRGIALACARAGARVVVTEKIEETGRSVAREISDRGGIAHFAACDVTHRAEVDSAIAAALDHFGRLDALVEHETKAHPGSFWLPFRGTRTAALSDRIAAWFCRHVWGQLLVSAKSTAADSD